MDSHTLQDPSPSINILGNGPPYALGNMVGHAIGQRMGRISGKGLHLETFLATMGGLAGFACQMSLREFYIHQQKKTEKEIFLIIGSPETALHYSGNYLHNLLGDGPSTVFGLIASALREIYGEQNVTREMLAPLAQSVVSEPDDKYGQQLDVPDKHRPHLTPVNLLQIFWPQAYAELSTITELNRNIQVLSWGLELANCIRLFLPQAKPLLPPCEVTFELIMRPMFGMARINPDIIIDYIKANKLEWSKFRRPDEKLDYPVYR